MGVYVESEPGNGQRPTTESETNNDARGERCLGVFSNPPWRSLVMKSFVASVYFLSQP